MPVKKSLTRLIAIVTLIVGCLAIAPASNCLGNCVGCESHSPSVCRAMVNADTGKRYSCLPYYTGSNCTLTANAYFVPLQKLRISIESWMSSPTGHCQSHQTSKNAHLSATTQSPPTPLTTRSAPFRLPSTPQSPSPSQPPKTSSD